MGIGRAFKTVETWWGALTPLRRFLLETTVAWVLIGILNYMLARSGAVVTWQPLVIGMGYLREYVLNGYVASALASGVAVGFWPYIVSAFKATAPLLRALWPIGALLAAFFIVPNIIDWWQSRNDPALFQLPPMATKNAATLKMEVLDKQPSELAAIYRNNTSLAADRLVKPYIGKWMAITGTVYDVAPPNSDGTIQIKLDGAKAFAILAFETDARGPIWGLKKHQRIRAFCQLVEVDSDFVGLRPCNLVP